jgi:hypothetical protein
MAQAFRQKGMSILKPISNRGLMLFRQIGCILAPRHLPSLLLVLKVSTTEKTVRMPPPCWLTVVSLPPQGCQACL